MTVPLVPFAFVGLFVIARRRERAREALLVAIILGASVAGLVRLHATGGYLSIRHAVIPGMILTIAAGAGLCWLTSLVAIPGRWIGLTHERFRLGPAVWVMLIAACAIVPYVRSLGPAHPGPFAVYWTAGDWLAEHTRPGEKVLDLTDWSLFFSGRDGYHFAEVYKAPADPRMRWVVTRGPEDGGRWHYTGIIDELVRGRAAVAQLPAQASPGELQISIYDCRRPDPLAAAVEFGAPEQAHAQR